MVKLILHYYIIKIVNAIFVIFLQKIYLLFNQNLPIYILMKKKHQITTNLPIIFFKL